MKISFIIPAYNEEASIGRCLFSIQKEIERGKFDAEIIVADNASTDKTGEVAASVPGVRVVREAKKGPNCARQAGLVVSSGELIANIDADTLLSPGWMDFVLGEFERNKNLVGLSGPYDYYDLPPLSRAASFFLQVVGYLFNALNRLISGAGPMFQGGNCVMRRDALLKIGGYDTAIEFYGDDVDTAQRLCAVGDVRFTLGLRVYSSGRRMKSEGLIRTNAKYVLNYVWKVATGKSLTKEHADVRVPVLPR